jgi:hypothetical protein
MNSFVGLVTEIYSSSEILALVLGLNHRQSLHKVLMTLQEQGLIRYAKVPVVGDTKIYGVLPNTVKLLPMTSARMKRPLPRCLSQDGYRRCV